MGLLEADILDEVLGNDELLFHLTAGCDGLTDNDTLGLRLEQDTSLGDGRSVALLLLLDTDAGESDLEDTDTLGTDLLSEFEVVFHRLTEFREHGSDITLLYTRLLLDILSELLRLDEILVIHCLGVEPAIGCRTWVVVLCFNKFLTHSLNF